MVAGARPRETDRADKVPREANRYTEQRIRRCTVDVAGQNERRVAELSDPQDAMEENGRRRAYYINKNNPNKIACGFVLISVCKSPEW